MVDGNQQQGQPIVLEAKLQVVELGVGWAARPNSRGRKSVGENNLGRGCSISSTVASADSPIFFGERDGRFEAPGPVGEADLYGA